MAKAPQQGAGQAAVDNKAEKCGIIMPIAGMPGYEPTHWAEVLALISRAITNTGRIAEPVWAGGAADIIQERIVRNLYEQPIAVCDVSGLNSNVMLELGMRLAFGKPTIIVTDEVLKPPFDINAIEYLPYPRDLHILRTEAFIERLAERIDDISDRARSNEYRPFIKTFGPIEPGTPGTDAIPLERAVLDQLEQMSSAIRRLERQGGSTVPAQTFAFAKPDVFRGLFPKSAEQGFQPPMTARIPIAEKDKVLRKLRGLRGVAIASLIGEGGGEATIGLMLDEQSDQSYRILITLIQDAIGPNGSLEGFVSGE